MTDSGIPDWQPESRPIPAELTPDFDHADYTPEATAAERMSGIPLMDRLDEVMRERLMELKGIL